MTWIVTLPAVSGQYCDGKSHPRRSRTNLSMPTQDNGTLELDNVSLSLDGVPLFSPLALAVGSGAPATVMGPSGCGKSSLLAYICGTLEPVFEARGTVHLSGAALNELPPERRHIGILFQDDLLLQVVVRVTLCGLARPCVARYFVDCCCI